jgi:hypothetical protein
MALFDKLKTSNYSLKGNPGPNFENEGQRTSSNIQALTKNNQLVSSQDLVEGRIYGKAPYQTKVVPSTLDLNGSTPKSYVNMLGSSNAGVKSQFNSVTGTGFTLDKRLVFSQLGMGGKPGPNFENIGQLTTSDIQASSKSRILNSSQDLLTGRKYGKGRFTVFVPASQLDGNGLPIGNVYKNKGPKEGRY